MNLNDYCADPTDPRDYLRQPVIVGEYRCACDGSFLVAEQIGDATSATDSEPLPDSYVDRFRAIFWRVEQHAEWQPLPDFDLPLQVPCEQCGETGRALFTQCDHCDGAGEVEAEFRGRSYWCDCGECDGSGKRYEKIDSVKIFGESFAPRYLARLREFADETQKPVEAGLSKSGPTPLLVFRTGKYLGAFACLLT